jgi:hypothetical protein
VTHRKTEIQRSLADGGEGGGREGGSGGRSIIQRRESLILYYTLNTLFLERIGCKVIYEGGISIGAFPHQTFLYKRKMLYRSIYAVSIFDYGAKSKKTHNRKS